MLKPVPVQEVAFVEDQVRVPATPAAFFPVVENNGPLFESVAVGSVLVTVTVPSSGSESASQATVT